MGLALINKALEEEREARLFQQWVVQLPYMSEDAFMSFEDYKNRTTGAHIDRRSTAEILAELDEVEKQFTEGEAAAYGNGDIQAGRVDFR